MVNVKIDILHAEQFRIHRQEQVLLSEDKWVCFWCRNTGLDEKDGSDCLTTYVGYVDMFISISD